MSYQVKCSKCGHLLINQIGEGSLFMSKGSKLRCRKCGHTAEIKEDFSTLKNEIKNSEIDDLIKFEI